MLDVLDVPYSLSPYDVEYQHVHMRWTPPPHPLHTAARAPENHTQLHDETLQSAAERQ